MNAKDENPLTSVRGRGHSSHLVCRTSGLLLLHPPPPSPSRLHGGFLFSPLQRAMDPEWRAKGLWLKCCSALTFSLTLILLQRHLLLSSARCLFSLPPLTSSYFLCLLPLTSSHLLFHQLSSTHSPLIPLCLFPSFFCSFPLSPSSSTPPFVLLICPSRRERLFNAGSQTLSFCSSSREQFSHFFEDRTRDAVPPKGWSHRTAAAARYADCS